MKFLSPTLVVCDGCNATAETTRAHRIFGNAQEVTMLPVPPEGWTSDIVQPSGVQVVRADRQVQLDMSWPAERIASAIGQPVPVFRCPACSARAKDRAVTLLDAFGAAKDGAA